MDVLVVYAWDEKAFKDDNDTHPVVIGGVNQKPPAATLVSCLL